MSRTLQRIVAGHLQRQGPQSRQKTAGEVIFRKDNSGEGNMWAYGPMGQSSRTLVPNFNYSPKNLKPLTLVLRSTLAALGHTCSALTHFAKLKSATVSPDGNLGGKGYIMKISDMRRQYVLCTEALSGLSDTLYDEINAPHWAVISRQESPEEKEEVSQILQEVGDIQKDPEGWAEEEFEEDGFDLT